MSAFPSPTPVRQSELAEGRKEESCCDTPPLQQQATTMDAVIKASFATLSLTAVVAHRLTAVDNERSADRDTNVLKRREYTALRNRYFGAYFFALFGNKRSYRMSVLLVK